MFLEIRMPPAQGGSILNNVLSAPQDAQIVHFSIDFIVGTYHIETSQIQFLDHKINHLRWHPSSRMRFAFVEKSIRCIVRFTLGHGFGTFGFE